MFKNFFVTAWRNFARNKVFTLLNVSGLAIGITVCLIIGVWLQRELSFDQFHRDGDKIFRLSNTFKSESESFSQAPSGPAFGAQLPKELPVVTSACRVFNGSFKLKSGNNQFIENEGIYADSNFFSFFNFKLKRGNPAQVLFSQDQIVLTEALATKYFGDTDPIGKTMIVDGKYPTIVSGVVENCPVNSQIQFKLVLPASQLKKQMKDQYDFDINSQWVGGWPMTYVKLNDPSKANEIQKQINAVAARFSEKEWKENKMSYYYFLQSLKDIHLKSNLRYDAANNGSLCHCENIFYHRYYCTAACMYQLYKSYNGRCDKKSKRNIRTQSSRRYQTTIDPAIFHGNIYHLHSRSWHRSAGI